MAVVKLYGEEYQLSFDNKYKANNQPVLEITDSGGIPSGVISVCIASHEFGENETAICSDVDQASIVEQLVKQGVAVSQGKLATSGYGRYPIVKILKN